MSFIRVDYCVVVCVEVWCDNGEILVSFMGIILVIGVRLVCATFSFDLLLIDGEVVLVLGVWSISVPVLIVVEGYLFYCAIFDLVWLGCWYVMMGLSQIDCYGNVNIFVIGDFVWLMCQLFGMCGVLGNMVSYFMSYWVFKHSICMFVERVDVVVGVGYDSVAKVGLLAECFFDLRRVVSNFGVFDFVMVDYYMWVVLLYLGVIVDEVVIVIGFVLEIGLDVVTIWDFIEEEMHFICEVIDLKGVWEKEVLL